MWLNFPPPATLHLQLPVGERLPAPSVDPINDLALPSHFRLHGQSVALTWVAERRSAMIVALMIMARRVRQVLPFERGLIYDVETDYEVLDDQMAHVTISASCAAEALATVTEAFLRAFEALRDGGARSEEIDRESGAYLDQALLPGARLSFLDTTTINELLGSPHNSPADIQEEYRSVTAAGIATALVAAGHTLLVASAEIPPPDAGLNPYPGWSSTVVQGRGHRSPGFPFGSRDRKDRLTVGDDGVTYRTADGHPVTVRYSECVAAQHSDGPVRELWGVDGFRVRIAAADWHHGARIIDQIDAHIPHDIVVCDEHGDGALQYPPRSESETSHWR